MNNSFTIKEMVSIMNTKLDTNDTKQDAIFLELTDIKIHLKELNGKVASNCLHIDNNKHKVDALKEEITSIKLSMAKYAGMITVLVSVLYFLLDYIRIQFV